MTFREFGYSIRVMARRRGGGAQKASAGEALADDPGELPQDEVRFPEGGAGQGPGSRAATFRSARRWTGIMISIQALAATIA